MKTVVAPRMAEAGRDREREFKISIQPRGSCKKRRLLRFGQLPATLLTIQTNVINELEYGSLYEQVHAAGKNPRPSDDVMYWNGDWCQTVELACNGILRHAYGGVYESFEVAWKSGQMLGARAHAGEPVPPFLPAIDLQVKAVSHVFDQCQLLAQLQLPFPWLVGVSIVGANGFHLITDSEKSPNSVNTDELHFGPCTITSLDQITDRRNIAGCLRDLLNRLCRKIGWERSGCFTSQGIVDQRSLGN